MIVNFLIMLALLIFAVLWQIKDVFKYAFDVRNPEQNVRDGAEAAMREVLGKSNLQ